MLDNRPAPPSAVKRQLRQEAGFGCCFCGHPFIQYHHIVPWAEDHHFRPEDMMVVCGQCHHLLTVGAIQEPEQRTAKARPKNIVDNHLKGTLYVTSKELRVALGGGLAIETPGLLNIAGHSVLSARRAEDGRILISAEIADVAGQVIAQLADNEWSMLPDAVWDFEVHPRHAAIRTAHGHIAFGVDARDDTVTMRGRWYYKGDPIEFTPTYANLRGEGMTGFRAEYSGNLFYIT